MTGPPRFCCSCFLHSDNFVTLGHGCHKGVPRRCVPKQCGGPKLWRVVSLHKSAELSLHNIQMNEMKGNRIAGKRGGALPSKSIENSSI